MRRQTITTLGTALFAIILFHSIVHRGCFAAEPAATEAASLASPQEWLPEEITGKVPYCEIQLRDFPGLPIEAQKRHRAFDSDYLAGRLADKMPGIEKDDLQRVLKWGSSEQSPGKVYIAYLPKDAKDGLNEAARLVPLEAARAVVEALNLTFQKRVEALKEDLDGKAAAARKVEEELNSLTWPFGRKDLNADEKHVTERIAWLEAALFECDLREAEVETRQEVLRGKVEGLAGVPTQEKGIVSEKILRDPGWVEWRKSNLLVFITPRIIRPSAKETEAQVSNERVSIEARFVEILPPGEEAEVLLDLQARDSSSSKQTPRKSQAPEADQGSSRARHYATGDRQKGANAAIPDRFLSLRGIMTADDLQFVWDTISQKGWCRYLTRTASVKDGQPAILRAVKDVTYTDPRGERTVQEGLVIEVTPSLGEPRSPSSLPEAPARSQKHRTMTLALIPRLSRIIAWDMERIKTGETMLEPQVETRHMTTTVHVNDGETVVLGGVMAGQSLGLKLPAAVQIQGKLAGALSPQVSAELARLEAEASGIKARKEMLEPEIKRLREQRERIAAVLPQYEKLKEELAARKDLLMEARKKYIEAKDALETSRPRIIEHVLPR